MSRIRIIDTIVIVIFITVWGFYILYEGQTRFDVNQTITLPLLIAAESTALAVLYAVARYIYYQTQVSKRPLGQILPSVMTNPPDKEDTVDKEGAVAMEDATNGEDTK